MTARERPGLEHEMRMWAAGYRQVAGLDEAGRGAWAGPVVAAAVVLPAGDPDLLARLEGVRDSKQLTPRQRETLLGAILSVAQAWGVGTVWPAEIDSVGIVAATRRAMELAVRAVTPEADALLIDHLTLPQIAWPQLSLTKGDVHVLSIAAASIVAKVHRDRLMAELAPSFPAYGFVRNKGYGTAQHRMALEAHGPCALHRLSYAPVRHAAAMRHE